ncbi:MAG TPA: hypothetical protein VNT99_19680, partial [Methylomirabilota bacterium]|nr:hypothetical protein [Methylomirabilota bacterium]
MKFLLATFAAAAFFITGCQAPKLSYKTPAPQLNPSGPALTVLSLVDARTNKAMDKVLAEGYLHEIQAAVADELRSMAMFRTVTVASNVPAPQAEFEIIPTLRRLDWEVPGYNAMLGKTFLISLLTGGIGGAIYISTGTDVYGHAEMSFELRASPAAPVLQNGYAATVTNEMAKAKSDFPKTKAGMASQALEATLAELK